MPGTTLPDNISTILNRLTARLERLERRTVPSVVSTSQANSTDRITLRVTNTTGIGSGTFDSAITWDVVDFSSGSSISRNGDNQHLDITQSGVYASTCFLECTQTGTTTGTQTDIVDASMFMNLNLLSHGDNFGLGSSDRKSIQNISSGAAIVAFFPLCAVGYVPAGTAQMGVQFGGNKPYKATDSLWWVQRIS